MKKKNNKNNCFNNVTKLSCIPNIRPKLRHEFQKIDSKVAFILGESLQRTLHEKTKLYYSIRRKQNKS